MKTSEILETRRKHFGDSLSIAYRVPLNIVRGSMQYLYDDAGREYLDCVNNVCHVGHCHPKVVQAAQDQIATLNTNTRYLHHKRVEYLQRLTALFPDPLSVCYLVCSGSEANDLALRMARAHTGGGDIIVLDGAYHGNTSALINISPYKYDGPGGSGAPKHVHQVPMPDTYRGRHSDPATAGTSYADYVRGTIDRVKKDDRKIAAFICESLLGCGGQIVLPSGYLETAYRYAREAGAVCIADEVQVGFGRVGTHFWGFETQRVIPDIVTLGKPIGNGHPMAAVITTPEIARSFDNGMEYFNTFGGNPVSCAIGIAVLDVIEEQQLQDNARLAGDHLKGELERLATRCATIGDVRGMGLFIGVELVRDKETRQPAADFATEVVERMKSAGILLSTDGPLHNVLKIKPPLVFTRENADYLVENLDRALGA